MQPSTDGSIHTTSARAGTRTATALATLVLGTGMIVVPASARAPVQRRYTVALEACPPGCPDAVRQAMLKHRDIDTIEVDADKRTATVLMKPGRTLGMEPITATLRGTGYKATGVTELKEEE